MELLDNLSDPARNADGTIEAAPESREALRSASPASINDRIRRAASGAEKAVEQQAVPPQYSGFVKRVFRRYADRAGPGPAPSAPSAPVTPDAPDAPRPVR